MVTCDEIFVHALTSIKSLTVLSNNSSDVSRPPLEVRVELYGIYKQATEGDVNISEPNPTVDYVSYTKWKSWKSNEGTSVNESKRRYVKRLILLLNSYGDDNAKVVELRHSLQSYWDQFTSKGAKYGSLGINRRSPTFASSPQILRSHSPAASMYRIASSGVNRPSSRLAGSRTGSLSGATLNDISLDEPHTGMSSYSDISQADEFTKWRNDINSTLTNIRKELAIINTGKKEDKSKGRGMWVLSKLGMFLNLVKRLGSKIWELYANYNMIRTLFIVIGVSILQKSTLYQRNMDKLQLLIFKLKNSIAG